MPATDGGDETQGLLNHIFLPPQLPQQEDTVSNLVFIQLVRDTLSEYRRLNGGSDAIDKASHLCACMSSIHGGVNVDEDHLRATLLTLPEDHSLAVNVAAQNAGLIITRKTNELVFEAFELSPKNAAILSTKGRIVRSFPALAVALDLSVLEEADFARMVAQTLATMSVQKVSSMQEVSRKARTDHDEDRDTASPAAVSELFFGMLRGIGETKYTTFAISKHTRDEVLWKDARRPWRRSSMWLLLRATLQLTITRASDGSTALYKNVLLLLMKRLLSLARQLDISAELLFTMHAKIDRRRQKLVATGSLDSKIATTLDQILGVSNKKIVTRWNSIRASSIVDAPLGVLSTLNFHQDTTVALPFLDQYIESIPLRANTTSQHIFKPGCGLLPPTRGIPDLPDQAGPYAAQNLRVFEQWIAESLDAWAANHTDQQAVCKELDNTISKYHAIASAVYTGNPEGISLMLLCTFEMWITLDRTAVNQCALLGDYDDGMLQVLMAAQALLLPFLSQMKRLRRVEEYLQSRSTLAHRPWKDNFDMDSACGFANQFYSSSVQLQTLHQTILNKAEDERRAKRQELHNKQCEYARLDDLYSGTVCDYTKVVVDSWCDPPETVDMHSGSCRKCQYRHERDSIKIQVHEWPLPEDLYRARAVIFELRVPEWLTNWRNSRFHVLNRILGGRGVTVQPRSKYFLSSNDPHLSRQHFRAPRHCIDMLSETKPVLVTHYSGKEVHSSTELTICVRNGLSYHYYDSKSGSYVSDLTYDNQVLTTCTYRLPQSVEALQKFLVRSPSSPDGPPPNAVIASQQECPADMALEEYKEVSSIPLGHRIQWANMLLQLAMPNVDFKNVETTLVFLQCMYQAGPSSQEGDALRASHEILHDDTTAKIILVNLHSALQRIKENWESVQALSTFVSIAARILSLNKRIEDACLALLASARAIASVWLVDLREKKFLVRNHAERTELISRSIEVALVCASTFDVDDEPLKTIMCGSDAHHLISASIVVQEGHYNRAVNDPNIARLELRFKRLLQRSYTILAQNGSEFDTAIRDVWSGYQASSAGWSRVSDHWITMQTENAAHVHYNLLDGELLVNGLPLDQPPQDYRKKPLYQTLFSDATVEIMPTSEPGFQFSTKRKFGGCSVLIGLQQDRLVVRATNQNGSYEAMSDGLLQDSYPHHFIHDYVHWYCLVDGTVRFQPKAEPWGFENAGSWVLSKHKAASEWTLVRNGVSVIGRNTSTAVTVGQVLKPIATISHVHCLLQLGGASLHVEIPPLRLGFTLEKSSAAMQSREYRSMVIDADQSLDTLVGFENKLILRSQRSHQRQALILEPLQASGVVYKKTIHHVAVSVRSRIKCKVHALNIDETLQRLLDNGSLDCKLYLAYLHGLTSFCLPDPVTSKTGTEQALTILRSKAVESFSYLSQSNVDMLARIRELSPGRSYYPSDKRVMQTIDWDRNISFFSQHEDFEVAASELLRQSDDTGFFYPDNVLATPQPKEIKPLLRDQARIRNSSLRTSGFGAEHHRDLRSDVQYEARDQGHESPRALRAAEMSRLVLRDGDATSRSCPSVSQLWSLLSKQPIVHGVQASVDLPRMRYDALLLKEDTFQKLLTRLPALCRYFKNDSSLHQRRFTFMAWLSTLNFADDADMSFIQLIAMCYKLHSLAAIEPPLATSFDTKAGHVLNSQQILQVFQTRKEPAERCPEWRIPRDTNERKKHYDKRRRSAWRLASSRVISDACQALTAQWPCSSPTTPNVPGYSTYIASGAMSVIENMFLKWFDNRLLHAYLSDVLDYIRGLPVQTIVVARLVAIPAASIARTNEKGFFSEADMFLLPVAPLDTLPMPLMPLSLSNHRESAQAAITIKEAQPRLTALVEKMESKSQCGSEIEYARDLRGSLQALNTSVIAESNATTLDEDHYMTYLGNCRAYTEKLYEVLVDAILSSATARAAHKISHLPRVSPVFLLKQLARDRWQFLSNSWKECIVRYALSLTALQRAERLVQLYQMKRYDDLAKELENSGHSNWDPHEFPETLLIEAESGIMVREVQEQIAGKMRQPASGCNAVMQLNMGEGKSSVIIPIDAAYLADGQQLVRVIVAKPQSKQMAHMLISKLGGLVGRRVYYMPFSRALQPSTSEMSAISAMVKKCMAEGGILLVQPEHILSFRLMVPEARISGKEAVAQSAMATQDFLDRHSRDLVDESDENYSPRFELIYTMGAQRLVEASPDRWTLLQQIFELVRKLCPKLAEELPSSIEVVAGVLGCFPRFRILRPDAAELLVSALAKQICEDGLDGFPVSRHIPKIRQAICAYITESEPPAASIHLVEGNPMVWTEANRPHLLILRGLFAEGVLSFVLMQKRWRVNYGLVNRVPPIKVAVPYRAKDTPALRSEFSHPDVVVALTLLSYYYQGLDDEQLFVALSHLSRSDQADIVYQDWVKDSNDLSSALKTLKGINLKDRPQCLSKLFPALRHGKSVIDYFVSHLVFPKEMKEFPHKLSASGWDIGKARDRLTTGFSGTIDSRHVLPLDVRYLELPEQKHTNALVMEYLLQPSNGVHLMSSASLAAERSDADNLLSCVIQLDPPVEVILDVGAQILELDNLEMAEAWLKLHDSKEAVVFVNRDDEICIVDRAGRVDPLRASPYYSRLDACLVFLDEAHTRGIDLILPPSYRAAVTLGPRLTKDRLVQACMRMRKLGKGQSVVFCISEEIQTKITEVTGVIRPSDISVAEVLEWSMQETHDEQRRNMPLWAVQGERYERQERIWRAARDEQGDTVMTKRDAEKLLEAEAQSLEDRYRPRPDDTPKIFESNDSPVIKQIADRCRAFEITQFKSSTLQEEQERELSPETEQERQIQRAPPAKPAKHELHPDVLEFATTGSLAATSIAYTDAFGTLNNIGAAADFFPRDLKGDERLFATADFAETVVRSGASFVQDSFLRSVQWILTSHSSRDSKIDRAMIISPFEANALLPRMAKSANTTLHLYRARVNSGYMSVDDLAFYSVPARFPQLHFPRSVAAQLNLFAGQLYINSYADYKEICKFLGLLPQKLTEEMEQAGWEVDAAGFIQSDNEGAIGGQYGLAKSPVGFMRTLMRLRRNGDGIGKTHMGRVLEGAVLREEEFLRD